MNKFKYILDCILELIYYRSDICLNCNDRTYNEELLCDKCRKNIVILNDFFYILNDKKIKYYSYTYYSGVSKNLILKMKYKNDFKSAQLLSKFIFNLVENKNIKCDLVTFVPSSKKQIKKRGYNQSEVLAYYLCRKLNLEYKNLLVKKEGIKDQIGLNEKDRWKNVQGAFSFNNRFNIDGKNILLVDDVVTTGATLYNCYKVLKDAGAYKIIIVTVAKNIS